MDCSLSWMYRLKVREGGERDGRQKERTSNEGGGREGEELEYRRRRKGMKEN